MLRWTSIAKSVCSSAPVVTAPLAGIKKKITVTTTLPKSFTEVLKAKKMGKAAAATSTAPKTRAPRVKVTPAGSSVVVAKPTSMSVARSISPRITKLTAAQTLLAPKIKVDAIKLHVAEKFNLNADTDLLVRDAKTPEGRRTALKARNAVALSVEKRDFERARASEMLRKSAGTRVLSKRSLIKTVLSNGKSRSVNWYGLYLKHVAPLAKKEGVSVMTYASQHKGFLTEANIADFKAQAEALRAQYHAQVTEKIPKRPLSGYAKFCQESWPSLKFPADVVGRHKVAFAATAISAMWKALSPAEKARYDANPAEVAAYNARMEKLQADLAAKE